MDIAVVEGYIAVVEGCIVAEDGGISEVSIIDHRIVVVNAVEITQSSRRETLIIG